MTLRPVQGNGLVTLEMLVSMYPMTMRISPLRGFCPTGHFSGRCKPELGPA